MKIWWMTLAMKVLMLFILLVQTSLSLQAQKIRVELGPDAIGVNQPWTISIISTSGNIDKYSGFPDIPGFRKAGSSSQSQTSIVNGRMSSTHSIIMNYMPTQQGTFQTPSFSMTVNGQTIDVVGKTISVGAPVSRSNPFGGFFDDDPFEDFFEEPKAKEYVDIKADAQFMLTTSKKEVYLGEGFLLTISFIVSDENRAPMEFYRLGQQLTDILKKIRPENCWEENFNLEKIEPMHIDIQGKKFSQYKLYQGMFYPLNTTTINFPKVDLQMVKYKVAKRPSFFSQDGEKQIETFFTAPQQVRVIPLPPHPLRDVLPVGVFRLEEKMPNKLVPTGKSVAYDFSIIGEGNISSLNKPMINEQQNLEFYEPNVRQTIRKENNRVFGAKTFSYFIVPQTPGEYPLKKSIEWIYFNIAKKKYDTLKSALTLKAYGGDLKNQAIEDANVDQFYEQQSGIDNELRKIDAPDLISIGAYLFALVGVGITLYMIIKK